MTASTQYRIKVLATGFMVLMFFAISFYWVRFGADVRLWIGLPDEARSLDISPSGLLDDAVENDPNADRHSEARSHADGGFLARTVGLVDYIETRGPGGRRSDVIHYTRGEPWMYFDRATGRLVFTYSGKVERADGVPVERMIGPLYAGPEGISDTPDAQVGRFVRPLVTKIGEGTYIVYDRKIRRFLRVDGKSQTVRTGPEVADTSGHDPVQIGYGRTLPGINVQWQAPMKRVLREDVADPDRRYTYRFTMPFFSGGSICVVNRSGRIDVLDSETLYLAVDRGTLPAPKTLYGVGSTRPGQLLDYDIHIVTLGSERQYVGMVVGSVSRQGTSMALCVFDASGKCTRMARTLDERHDPPMPSAEAGLFNVPWGPALAVLKYALENVHPPVLTVASFFAANRIEAAASHQSLFLIPNSFAAMHRDLAGQSIVSQFFQAFWFMIPAYVLAGLLAWRVARDVSGVGLSGQTRLLWIVGTLAFGLPAYITYRVTRPKEALVTCLNCGRMRRPDGARCHRCNSLWDVPELVPPTWQVLNGTAPLEAVAAVDSPPVESVPETPPE